MTRTVMGNRDLFSYSCPRSQHTPRQLVESRRFSSPYNLLIRFTQRVLLPVELRVVDPRIAKILILIEDRYWRVFESNAEALFILSD